jgi:disulfide bond formation protein DsbB
MFEGCTIEFDSSKDLMQQIMERPAARCDEIAWSFMGLSMAAWNTALAAILSGICAAGVIRNRPL